MYMCLQSREEREQAKAEAEDVERATWVQLLKVKVMKMNEARFREFEAMATAAATK